MAQDSDHNGNAGQFTETWVIYNNSIYQIQSIKIIQKVVNLNKRRIGYINNQLEDKDLRRGYLVSFSLKRFKLILILIKMCQTLAQNEDSKTINLSHQRLKHLNYFFHLKEKMRHLTRQTLFLGIAICDKFFQRIEQAGGQIDEIEGSCEVRAVACLWVGWKFIETDKIPIKKLLEKIQLSITSQEVIQMQYQILEKIDFQIPTTTPYATMTHSFNSLSDRRNQTVIAGQCIKFLIEALKLSKEFSLCGELGPKIVELYKQRSLDDVRIRSVYMKIQNKQTQKMMQAVQAC